MPLLKQFQTQFGTIRITRSKIDGSLSYYQNGCFHSQTKKNGVSVCVYIHAIHEIIRQAKAKRVLMIGCGGGSLATMLHRLGCEVTVVDINPAAFPIARDYFKMPKAIETICCDGIKFVADTLRQFDAVIIDVFGSNNTVPRDFTTRSFFDDVNALLSNKGVMVMNVITKDDDDRRAARIAKSVQNVVGKTLLVDWPGEIDRNSLIVAGMKVALRLPSGFEPDWIADDMEGLRITRVPNTAATAKRIAS